MRCRLKKKKKSNIKIRKKKDNNFYYRCERTRAACDAELLTAAKLGRRLARIRRRSPRGLPPPPPPPRVRLFHTHDAIKKKTVFLGQGRGEGVKNTKKKKPPEQNETVVGRKRNGKKSSSTTMDAARPSGGRPFERGRRDVTGPTGRDWKLKKKKNNQKHETFRATIETLGNLCQSASVFPGSHPDKPAGAIESRSSKLSRVIKSICIVWLTRLTVFR